MACCKYSPKHTEFHFIVKYFDDIRAFASERNISVNGIIKSVEKFESDPSEHKFLKGSFFVAKSEMKTSSLSFLVVNSDPNGKISPKTLTEYSSRRFAERYVN